MAAVIAFYLFIYIALQSQLTLKYGDHRSNVRKSCQQERLWAEGLWANSIIAETVKEVRYL